MSIEEKAFVNSGPVFDLRAMAHACLEKTSIQVRRYLFLSLHFEKAETSAKSACHKSSMPTVKVLLLLDVILAGLCKVYASLFFNHYKF